MSLAEDTDALRAAKEYASQEFLDWAPHEDGSISVFHARGAARVTPDGQVMSLPNPQLKAALERKIAESEHESREGDHSMDHAEQIFADIAAKLEELTERQVRNVIELCRAELDERAGKGVIQAEGATTDQYPTWARRILMTEDICTHRAPGTCCPEPSCDHGWHGAVKALIPRDAECEGCGKKCKECKLVWA